MSDIRIIKFWTHYAVARDGDGTRPVDMVEYCVMGMGNRSTNISAVSKLSKLPPLVGAEDNISVALAHARWNAIEPAYRAWKANEDVPHEGTPLAAWSGVTPEQAEVLKKVQIRTVEEVAGLTEVAIARVGLPSIRNLIALAKGYLESTEKGKAAAAIAEMRSQIEARDEEMAELRELLKQQAAAQNDAPRRGPGRPPKSEAQAS